MSGARIGSLCGALISGLLGIYLWQASDDAAHVRRADEAGRAKQYEQVLTETELVSNAPADARALVARARALTALRRAGAADAAWRKAAERNPNQWQIHLEWANSLAFLGNRAGARRRFERAVELNPRLRPDKP